MQTLERGARVPDLLWECTVIDRHTWRALCSTCGALCLRLLVCVCCAHMHRCRFFLRQAQVCFVGFYVVEQDDKELFDRGWLINIGAKMAFEDGATYFVMHDVDSLPLPGVPYTKPDYPLQLSAEADRFEFDVIYEHYAGGVFCMTKCGRQMQRLLAAAHSCRCEQGSVRQDQRLEQRLPRLGRRRRRPLLSADAEQLYQHARPEQAVPAGPWKSASGKVGGVVV
jgi:hypothetical protein